MSLLTMRSYKIKKTTEEWFFLNYICNPSVKWYGIIVAIESFARVLRFFLNYIFYKPFFVLQLNLKS